MNLAIFGLVVSSSWGNGHAALWRGLIAALLRQGHAVTFFERDEPWYAASRDLADLPEGGRLVVYREWSDVQVEARRTLMRSDVAMLTSYCPDAQVAADLLENCAGPIRCFYDLDTAVTLARLGAGEQVAYLPEQGLGLFDLVLSYTGGEALDLLRDRLGARRVVPLYGWVDPAEYRPAAPAPQYRADLSYLGTYAEDRQASLVGLFVEPARQRPESRFVIGGAMYPQNFPWTANIHFVRHLPPAEHAAFYSSSRVTLNVTRAAMARMGWCPSGRLFEAAACGTPILSDWWDGLDAFFEPGREILVAESAADTLAALAGSDAELRAMATRARERVLAEHTADHRAAQLVNALQSIPAEA